ncbi:MAG: hypothetical protein ACQKBV_09830 [Puniceicoccales bacterium]
MITQSLKSPEPAFQFGGHTSVTFNGDFATLYIGRLDNNGEAATPRLQIWALGGVPSGDQLSGVLLGEAEAQTLNGGYYLEYITLDANLVDSVRGLHTIVVTVARAGAIGWYDDLVVMPDLIDFYHPQLVQPAAARLTADGFTASVAAISNPRSADFVSGSLVVELWALADQNGFTGNDFHLGGIEYLATPGGEVTAPVEFGSNCTYPQGSFYPALVLREWTGSAYLVRDRIVGENPLQLPPQLDAIADAFNAPAPQAVVEAPVKVEAAKPAAKKATTPAKAEAPKKAAAPAKTIESRVAEDIKAVQAEAKQATEALKQGPAQAESVQAAKKVVVKTEPKKVVKTVETPKVTTKKAAKSVVKKDVKKAASPATKKAAKKKK